MSRDLLRSSLVYQVNDQVYSKLERQVRVSPRQKQGLTVVVHLYQSVLDPDPEKRSLPPSPAHQALL